MAIALLNDWVYDEIKKKIIDNEFTPGERIDIEALSNEFGVSRTPVITALKALDKDGYITVKQRSGSYIRNYTPEELEALYDFRAAVECMAIKKAIPHADPARVSEFLRHFEETARQIDAAVNLETMLRFFDEQLRFHFYLLELCPQIIANELKNLIDLTRRIGKLQLIYITRNIPDNVSALKAEVDMHVRLAKAVIDKDVALAQRLIEKDHMSTRNCIISHFDEIEALQMECCRDFAEFGHSVNM